MGNNNSSNSQKVQAPQLQFYDDQETFSLDFNELESSFLTPIDNLRSHFNALAPNSKELNSPQYQESRCSTFYRMVGFPVVAPSGSFHSPGFDPNLNTESDSLTAYAAIDQAIIKDNVSNANINNREQVFKAFNKIFSNGGLNAQAVAFGSVYIRSFVNTSTAGPPPGPLVVDTSQVQVIGDRLFAVNNFYGGDTDFGGQGFKSGTANFSGTGQLSGASILSSYHFLSPFTVDPRIDGYVRPIKNKMCAPFLKDKSQTKIFLSSDGTGDSLQRPYLERVISVRFNGQNVAGTNSNITTTSSTSYVQSILSEIRKDNSQTDPDLLAATSNALSQLYNNELVIFNNYYKIMRVVIQELVSDIRDVQYIMQNINFDPIPSPTTGIEGGVDGGGQLPAVSPNDPNNKPIETNIITMMQNQAFNNVILDAGLQGIPDPGDFAFSNLDDSVFSVQKNLQQSYAENITKLTGYRTQLGNEGIDSLRNIEIIMGEFSGIGLIDIIAIQAALWIMPEKSLLGLIDARAYARLQKYRTDLNVNDPDGSAISPNPIMQSLTEFETALKTVYSLIQNYYDSIYNGSVTTAPGTA
jgi:hypothetical protein